VTTLIFDCDGVISDTERYGHLPAYNATFKEFGIPVEWSEDDYAIMLQIAGGKERMLKLFTPEFVAANNLPTDPEAQKAEVARWHKYKTDVYAKMVNDGLLPPRTGIARIMRTALDAGWQLAVASTSAHPAVLAVLHAAIGKDDADRFAQIFAGDIVPKKKPAPDIYLLAMETLGADPADTIVIEDSRNGLRAATAAGLATVVTVNGYTEEEDFSEARLVVSSLGDPGVKTEVLANRSAATPGDMITLDDLLACLPNRN
jgi:HAD superfamily hydrolase (TIGR01509 family)